MSHPIDNMLPKPKFDIAAGEHVSIYVQAVGPQDKPRGEHGFGMIATGQHGMTLCRFGYRSSNPETTVNRGYFGALLSALVWRARYAPANKVTIKTRLDYIYQHFNERSEGWVQTGKRSGNQPVENLDLVTAAYGHWTTQKPVASLMRTPDFEDHLADEVKEIATSMRDNGAMERIHKPGDPYEFDIIEEDMDDLINYAVARDNRLEERKASCT